MKRNKLLYFTEINPKIYTLQQKSRTLSEVFVGEMHGASMECLLEGFIGQTPYQWSWPWWRVEHLSSLRKWCLRTTQNKVLEFIPEKDRAVLAVLVSSAFAFVSSSFERWCWHKEWEIRWSPITANLSVPLLPPLRCNHDQQSFTF